MKVKSLSRVRLFATPWTVAYQAPPSMGFSRQEYWSGLPFPLLFFFLNLFIICLILAALGLHCCLRALSSCGEQGLLFAVVCGLLTVVASLAVGLQ